MAEIQNNQKQGRRKTKDPRIDLTPMVDLGFLLITFFIYTTTIAKPRSMELILPDNTPVKEPIAFPEECTVTLIPTKNHKVIYYTGALSTIKQLHVSDFSASGIRKVLHEKNISILGLSSSFSKEAHKLHIIVKPANDCTFQDIVSTMDETSISNAPYVAIVDISDIENEMIIKKLQ